MGFCEIMFEECVESVESAFSKCTAASAAVHNNPEDHTSFHPFLVSICFMLGWKLAGDPYWKGKIGKNEYILNKEKEGSKSNHVRKQRTYNYSQRTWGTHFGRV